MFKGLWNSVFQFAWQKKTLKEKFQYLCKGLVFLPFLWVEQKGMATSGENDVTSQSSSGDDVYPLF